MPTVLWKQILNLDNGNFKIEELLRPAMVVPESKRLNVLLREFRENRNHMAIVIDEYGGVAGLVTIEDVLEEIVGEIEDETDARPISAKSTPCACNCSKRSACLATLVNAI